ncbi:MAG: bifunctional UDP-N-acetylglucosamine diphosphorylase/glucosamine-1-phosphate N-acetyltransferase GlmU [Proteobacteria bacterium]|nr:bifunctional UDP-N-acetylglucosamine diphosphorylase/glucosamine-1-phosphate N-acetyltransferase GlmU [Pseudomonadota bacterium]
MPLSIIILAAGQGVRMKSSRPKVMHALAGKPMLQHVVDTCLALEPDQIIVVVGHQSERVRSMMHDQGLEFVEQSDQQGTGHAVAQCLPVLNKGNDVIVLYGDVPLISVDTIRALLDKSDGTSVNILSFLPQNSQGYGRIQRSADDNVEAIVEENDASAEQKKIRESNSGILFIVGEKIGDLIGKLENNNVQGEYLLTDVVKHAVQQGLKVAATICSENDDLYGVNNQAQLAEVEKIYRCRQVEKLMRGGVKLYDPARIDVRGTLQVGTDIEIDINCVFEGDVSLSDRVKIGANCVIRNSTIGSDSIIQPMSSIDGAVIGNRVSIGPFARIRPGTECADEVKIGNFVETKKSQIGAGSKVNHLSYIGDAEIGAAVNIGAGTITCNYDGVNKFKTIIEDGVFIGSNTQLVAPVRIARGATIGAGSTITSDTPADKLTLSRSKQVTIDAWKKPARKNRE